MPFNIIRDDITRVKCDAIVNAANSRLLGCFQPCHDCVDNLIHTMSGIQLRLACNELMQAQAEEEPAGRAKITRRTLLSSARHSFTVPTAISAARSCGKRNTPVEMQQKATDCSPFSPATSRQDR